jgi:hypothetical protein
MTVTVEIPDNLAEAITTPDNDAARAVLEAVALEGYRTERLSEYEIQQLLGFESRMDVHGFLKQHGAFMHYTIEDMEQDTASAMEVARRVQSQREHAASQRPAE